MTMVESLRIGITWDFLTEGARLLDNVLPKVIDGLPGVSYEYMPRGASRVIEPAQVLSYDAVIALHHVQFTLESFVGVERLAVIARWGVGYDMIDVPACTEHDVALCITPDAVRRPVAEGIVALMLALSKHIVIEDRLTRAGRWSEKTNYVGKCLAGRVLGCVGLGNIGAELVRLLNPFGLARVLAYDPYVSAEQAAAAGAELVDLPTLMKESDYVSINCLLTKETYHLIGERELALMKPTAYLINTARGPIMDQDALTKVLQSRQIAGAGLDVFEKEPIASDDPLLTLENVIVTPHGLAWTEELTRDNGVGASENALAILRGGPAQRVVNRDVLAKPGFQAKLKQLGERWQAFNR